MANALISIQASGAPSLPCIGAWLRSFKDDRSTPIGRSCPRVPARFVLFLLNPFVPGPLVVRFFALDSDGRALLVAILKPPYPQKPIKLTPAKTYLPS